MPRPDESKLQLLCADLCRSGKAIGVVMFAIDEEGVSLAVASKSGSDQGDRAVMGLCAQQMFKREVVRR